ncbi:MAG: hypothetical protein GX897_06055 [Clostridiales bacterium]|nr:hypothetical protein [Clostridiales bacterium]
MTFKLSTKMISALLLLALMLSMFSCGETDESVNEQTNVSENIDETPSEPAETEAEKLSDNLESRDLNGWEMRVIAHHDHLSNESTIYSAEMDGEIINDLIFQRDRSLEDRFNFKYTVIAANGWNDNYIKLKNSVMSGSRDYDMAFLLPFSTSGSCVKDQVLYNMNAVPNIDFSRPWWHTNVNELFTYKNYLPFVSSDYLLSSYQYSNILIFNKVMAENYGLDDIYSAVRNGTWTLEPFGRMCEAVTEDINGDGKFDVNDQYGLATNYGYHAITWGYAIGDQSVTLNDDGTVTLGYNNERFFTLCEWLYNLLYASNQAFEIGWDLECEIRWNENRLLFQAMWLNDLEKYREVTIDYGVIPYPKFNEEQPLYHTYTDARSGGVAIPMDASPEVIDMDGLILEAMSCYNYNEIIPEYISSVTETKLSRDEESIEMMGYIARGRIWDIGYTMTATDSYTWAIQHWLKPSGGQIASYLEKNESRMIKSFDKIIEAYEELAAMDWPAV